MWRPLLAELVLALALTGCGAPSCPEPGPDRRIESGPYQAISADAQFLGTLSPPGGRERSEQRLEIDREGGTARLSYRSDGRELVEVYVLRVTRD
jgi:hypothetical protein